MQTQHLMYHNTFHFLIKAKSEISVMKWTQSLASVQSFRLTFAILITSSVAVHKSHCLVQYQ